MCGRYQVDISVEDMARIVAEAQARADAAAAAQDRQLQIKFGEVFPTDTVAVLVAADKTPAPPVHNPQTSSKQSDTQFSILNSQFSIPELPALPVFDPQTPSSQNNFQLSTFNFQLQAVPMVWGFPNFGGRKGVVFNTRSEQAAVKPIWADSFANRRCIIPTTGFYEWRHDGGKKTRLHFTDEDSPLLYLAGIYKPYPTAAAGDSRACALAVEALHNRMSILTTAANAQMAPIHDRMPVILDARSAQGWLSGGPDCRTWQGSLAIAADEAGETARMF